MLLQVVLSPTKYKIKLKFEIRKWPQRSLIHIFAVQHNPARKSVLKIIILKLITSTETKKKTIIECCLLLLTYIQHANEFKFVSLTTSLHSQTKSNLLKSQLTPVHPTFLSQFMYFKTNELKYIVLCFIAHWSLLQLSKYLSLIMTGLSSHYCQDVNLYLLNDD